MRTSTAKVLMASVILARSTSFLFSKTALAAMGLFELLGIRFFLAFLVLVLIYRKRIVSSFGKDILLRGTILGVVLYLVMASEMMALKQSDIYLTAFLENSAFLFVPLILWVADRQKPTGRMLFFMAVMTAGVALLTLKGTAQWNGILWGLGAAFFYGLFIFLTGKLAAKSDGIALGIWQMGVMGVLNLVSSAAVEEMSIPVDPGIVVSILALTFLCSAFGFTFQTEAQKYISTADAGLFSALDPLFATLWGLLFRGENPGLSGAAGALLVLTGMIGAQGRGKILPFLRHRIKRSTDSV